MMHPDMCKNNLNQHIVFPNLLRQDEIDPTDAESVSSSEHNQ